jgi:hypothetical protein
MAATFELERFTWDEGAFEVAGRWRADSTRSLGRVRLVLEIDGRRRRIGAQGGKQASADPSGNEWVARFGCARRPEHVGKAELEIGGDLLIDLPRPELPPREEPAPKQPAPDVRGAEALLERLRSERAEIEAATRKLADERAAAEAAARKLAKERAGAESAAKAANEAAERASKAKPPDAPPARAARPLGPVTPRREAIRESLSLPREPRSVLPVERPGHQRELAYALAALIVILIVLLFVLLL